MKEQAEKLFRAVGEIGDDLIERADQPVKKTPRIWVKWAALAACCALVIGAAALVLPMFRAGSSASDTAQTVTLSSAPDTEYAEAPLTEEAAPAEAAEAPEQESAVDYSTGANSADVRALPDADCFAVLPESVTRTAADITLANDTGLVLALRSEYRLERLEDGQWVTLTTNAMPAQEEDSTAQGMVYTLHYDWSAVYGELPDGEYCLIQPVVLADGSETELSAQFTVQ